MAGNLQLLFSGCMVEQGTKYRGTWTDLANGLSLCFEQSPTITHNGQLSRHILSDHTETVLADRTEYTQRTVANLYLKSLKPSTIGIS